MSDLRELQTLFWQAIAAAPAACGRRPAPDVLVQCVLPGPRLAPVDRLDVYAGMYFWRLHEVLREDFARVAAIVGGEAFEELVAAYLARHPSTHPSVRHLGRHFAAFIGTDPLPRLQPYLAELARLEWARVSVFDAPDATPLRAADVAGLAPGEWPGLRLGAIPALEVLELAWPVQRVWTGAAEVAPEPTALRVWRDGFVVYHASMAPLEAEAVRRLVDGTTFADVCELCDTPEEAGGMIGRWLEDGIVGRL